MYQTTLILKRIRDMGGLEENSYGVPTGIAYHVYAVWVNEGSGREEKKILEFWGRGATEADAHIDAQGQATKWVSSNMGINLVNVYGIRETPIYHLPSGAEDIEQKMAQQFSSLTSSQTQTKMKTG